MIDYRRTERELKGLRARTTRELSNGWATIAAGTLVTITGKRSGLTIRTERCPHCSVAVHMTKVRPEDLELVEAAA